MINKTYAGQHTPIIEVSMRDQSHSFDVHLVENGGERLGQHVCGHRSSWDPVSSEGLLLELFSYEVIMDVDVF